MPTDTPQAARDRWCDVEGSRIALFCWVEQVAEHPEHGAVPIQNAGAGPLTCCFVGWIRLFCGIR